MFIMLLKVYCSSFSAVAAGTFDWPMIRHFTNQGWMAWMDSTYFQMQSVKKKGKHGKYSIEIHNGKYST